MDVRDEISVAGLIRRGGVLVNYIRRKRVRLSDPLRELEALKKRVQICTWPYASIPDRNAVGVSTHQRRWRHSSG